jgi:hypothetical protein
MSQLQKQFQNVSISREQYRNVRTMVTPSSITQIRALGVQRLIEIRFKMQQFRAEITHSVDNKRGVVVLKNVMFQYVPADEQVGKRWAYKQAIESTIKLVNELITAKTDVVSPLLAAEELQAEPAQPAPAEAVSDLVEDELEGMALRAY